MDEEGEKEKPGRIVEERDQKWVVKGKLMYVVINKKIEAKQRLPRSERKTDERCREKRRK